MSYSYDRYLGIFYMQYRIDMITYGTAFGEPVVGTCGYKNNPMTAYRIVKLLKMRKTNTTCSNYQCIVVTYEQGVPHILFCIDMLVKAGDIK